MVVGPVHSEQANSYGAMPEGVSQNEGTQLISKNKDYRLRIYGAGVTARDNPLTPKTLEVCRKNFPVFQEIMQNFEIYGPTKTGLPI